MSSLLYIVSVGKFFFSFKQGLVSVETVVLC